MNKRGAIDEDLQQGHNVRRIGATLRVFLRILVRGASGP
jgi:hypothetical protein